MGVDIGSAIGFAVLGAPAGLLLHRLVYRLPTILERQWYLEACEILQCDPHPQASSIRVQANTQRRSIGTVLAASTIAFWVGLTFSCSWSAAAALVFGWGLLCLSLIDFDKMLLPDVLVLPLLWLGVLVNSFGLFTSLHNSLWGVVLGYLILWSVRALSKCITGRQGLGQGDMKLLAMLGAWGGWQVLPLTLLLASLVGASIGGALLLLGKIDRQTPIPFGPSLAIAGWVSFFYMPPFFNAWLSIFHFLRG